MCMSVLSTYQDFLKIFVGDVGELGTVELGDHELCFADWLLALSGSFFGPWGDGGICEN